MNHKFHDHNLVHTLALYEWANSIQTIMARDLFDRIAAILGSSPDHAEVWGEPWQGKGYTFRNFVKRDVIHRQNWRALNYLWKRQPDALLYFSANCHFSLDPRKYITVLVDEAAVTDIKSAMESVISELIDTLQPIYGIGFQVPYSWDPMQFAYGSGPARLSYEDEPSFDSPKAFGIRGGEFGHVLMAEPRGLDHRLRDVFEINLISAGHLAAPIQGQTLEEWILRGGRGTLRKVASSTWRWDISTREIKVVRQAVTAAGLIAAPIWTGSGFTVR